MNPIYVCLLCVMALSGCELVLAPIVIPANALIDKFSRVQPVLVKDSAGRTIAGPEKPNTPAEAEFIVARGMVQCSGTIDKIPGYAGANEEAEFRCTSGQRGKVVFGAELDSWGPYLFSTISVSDTRKHSCSSSFDRNGRKAGPFQISCHYWVRVTQEDGRQRWYPEGYLDKSDRQYRETGAAHVYQTQSGKTEFTFWLTKRPS